MAGISVKLPLFLSKADGAYGLNKNLKDVIKQNLKMLLLTIPGERMMLPEFGIGIPRYLFEPNTPEIRTKIHLRIGEQVLKYMPFLSLSEVIVSGEDESGFNTHQLYIKIKYFIEPIGEEDILSLNLPQI